MRQIGHIESESRARLFEHFLRAQGIESRVEAGADTRWAVWVMDDDQLAAAGNHLRDFLANPVDARYDEAALTGRKIEAEQAAAQRRWEKNQYDRKRIQRLAGQPGYVTLMLVTACVAVAIYTSLGKDAAAMAPLRIASYITTPDGYLQWSPQLPDVMRGEVWRLFTPALLHSGLLHLLFNLLWLRELGSMIERTHGSLLLAAQVLVIAVLSNLAQFYVSGPFFGGMSGVVYGLLCYIWIRAKFDPNAPLLVRKETVVMMIVWFFLCLLGLIKNVANTVHAVGAIVGVTWGYMSARLATRR